MMYYTWYQSIEAAREALGLTSIFELLDSGRFDLHLDGVGVIVRPVC